MMLKGFRKQIIVSFSFILLLIFVYNFYVFVGLTKIENAGNNIIKIQEQISFLKSFSFWILLIVIIFISGVMINVILNLTFSLKEIIDGIEEIKLGNLEYQIPLKTDNEFGNIASFLNEAIKNIRDSQTKLQEKEMIEAEILQGFNVNLKKEIAEQTSELINQLKEKTNELEKLKKK